MWLQTVPDTRTARQQITSHINTGQIIMVRLSFSVLQLRNARRWSVQVYHSRLVLDAPLPECPPLILKFPPCALLTPSLDDVEDRKEVYLGCCPELDPISRTVHSLGL